MPNLDNNDVEKITKIKIIHRSEVIILFLYLCERFLGSILYFILRTIQTTKITVVRYILLSILYEYSLDTFKAVVIAAISLGNIDLPLKDKTK